VKEFAMTFELTVKQQEALEAAGDMPVRLTLPQINREYVVIPAEVYDRLRLLTEALTMAQVGDLVEQTMREYDEGDPTLESYQRYRS
jgi:hypothetical protein